MSIKIPSQYSTVTARGDRIVVSIPQVSEETSGGIILPSSMRSKPGYGKVIALGDGCLPDGKNYNFQTEIGQSLLFTTFAVGRTRLDMEATGDQLTIMPEGDVIGVLPAEVPDYTQIAELKPIFNSVLLRMAPEEVSNGVVIFGSQREKPKCGHIIRMAPGRIVDGERKPIEGMKDGDFVCLRGGGTEIDTGEDLWNVVDASYIVGHMPFASDREIYELEPMDDWMVLKLEEPPETTKSGLLLNKRLSKQITLAVVVKAGPGAKDPMTNELKPNEFEEGDRVMFKAENIKSFEGPTGDDSNYILLQQRDIISKIE